VAEPERSAIEPFLLEQFKALREEILGKIERVVRIQLIGITAIPLVIGAGEKYDLTAVIAAGPIVTIVFALILLYEQNGIMRAGRYIRQQLEPALRTQKVLGWEEWLEHHPVNRKAERFFAWSTPIAFSLYYIGGTFLAYQALSQQYAPAVATTVLALYAGAFVVALYLVVTNFVTGTRAPDES
jgi:hypothetical protein